MSEDENKSPRRSMRLVGLFFGVAVFAVALDAVTKMLALAGLEEGRPVRLLGGAVYLSLIHNSGAAFGLASDFTIALTVLATLVVVAICWYAYRKLGSLAWAVSLGMVAGGAAGNLADRLFRPPGFMTGHVVDFISLFHPYGAGWAIFNVADSALVLGVIWVVLLELTGRRIDGIRIQQSKQDDTGVT